MRVMLCAAALVAMALSGCAEGPAPVQQESFSEDLGRELQATATTGVIRGVVIDSTITPVQGATVKVLNTEMSTTSDEDGFFGFKDLEGGTYFLETTKIGYGKVQTSAEVVAGVDDPPVLRVSMEANPSQLPYTQPYTFNGYIACSWTLPVVALAMCSVPELIGVDLDDNFITFIDTDGVPTFTQGEQIWDSTQAFGDALSFSIYDGDTTAPAGGSSRGTSPLILRHDYEYWNSTDPQRMVQYEEQFSYRTFSSGHPATSGVGWGVGITLEQEFEVYTHVFWNWQPEEDWLFIIDGSPVPPS